MGNLGGVAADGGGGCGVDLEVEAGGESDGAHHAQLVLGEAQGGVADGADDAASEVFAAVDEVERGGCGVARCFIFDGIEEHSVDGEVAAEYIFARVGGVTHCIGTAAVGVGAVGAEGGDLGGDLDVVDLIADEDNAEVRADGEGLGEEGDDLIGRGGGGDVEVLGREAQQQVAHASAGEEGLMARIA